VLVGILLRLLRYLRNDSLWADEAALALNIVGRSFDGLFRPLDYKQGAPVLFLVIEKLVTIVSGNTEYALRLFPLMAGIATIGLVYLVGRRCLGSVGLVAALALTALSMSLLGYSSEVKPYSSDAMASVAVVLVTLMAIEDQTPRSLVRAGAVGSIALLLSFPAILVLAACGLVTLVTCTRSNPRFARQFIGVVAVWLVVVSFDYWFFLRPLTINVALLDYWGQRGFWPASTWEDLSWFVVAPLRLFLPPTLGLGPWWLSAAAFGLGVVFLIRRNAVILGMVLLSAAGALCAAALHTYPFSGRLLLFLVPGCLIVIAAGFDLVVEMPWRLSTAALVGMACLLLFRPVADAATSLARHEGRENLKPLLDAAVSQSRPGDLLYVYTGAANAFEYYTRYRARYQGLNRLEVIRGIRRPRDASDYEIDLQQLSGHRRVWVLLSHAWNEASKRDEEALLNAYLAQMGTRLMEIRESKASLYLYDLSARPN
jgi:hypothetical protein